MRVKKKCLANAELRSKRKKNQLEYIQFPDEALYECKSIDKLCESQSHRIEIKTNDFVIVQRFIKIV